MMSFWLAVPVFAKDAGSPIGDEEARNARASAVNALVDTLIPADALTPAASAVGVGSMLMEQAEKDTAFRPWLIEGIKWLDQGVPGSFARREESTRVALLEQLAATAPGTQTRTFSELVRVRVMTAYYADPRSRVGLAIARPPQPIGYPDFAGPV